jgi:hypothetical protein
MNCTFEMGSVGVIGVIYEPSLMMGSGVCNFDTVERKFSRWFLLTYQIS